jgi:hypothetical protein
MPEKVLYFAHPTSAYDTPYESRSIERIVEVFLGFRVENPNQPHHQEGYRGYQVRTAKNRDAHKGMNYFYEEVLPSCDGCIAMAYLDGRLGLGVAGEAKWFLERKLPVWGLFPSETDPYIIRQFTDIERQQILLTDVPPLVVPHQETRLRTWVVYNEIGRPFESAHLISMSVPPGFYPEKK